MRANRLLQTGLELVVIVDLSDCQLRGPSRGKHHLLLLQMPIACGWNGNGRSVATGWVLLSILNALLCSTKNNLLFCFQSSSIN